MNEKAPRTATLIEQWQVNLAKCWDEELFKEGEPDYHAPFFEFAYGYLLLTEMGKHSKYLPQGITLEEAKAIGECNSFDIDTTPVVFEENRDEYRKRRLNQVRLFIEACGQIDEMDEVLEGIRGGTDAVINQMVFYKEIIEFAEETE